MNNDTCSIAYSNIIQSLSQIILSSQFLPTYMAGLWEECLFPILVICVYLVFSNSFVSVHLAGIGSFLYGATPSFNFLSGRNSHPEEVARIRIFPTDFF